MKKLTDFIDIAPESDNILTNKTRVFLQKGDVIMAMNIDFTGKTVLVTGGGRGLGKETALQFAGCGANVYIANRKEDQGMATVKEIEALGVKGGFSRCDVAVEEDVKNLIADAAAFGGGKIDVIVNAAGVISLQDIMHTTTEEVQRLFNINVVGSVHMIKHGLAHLEANKSGNMILVSSIAGRDGMGMLQTYSASKAAVTSLMQSAAKHAAPYGVRVNAILPGIIRTSMWDEILEGMNNGWDPEVHNELTPEHREALWNESVKNMIPLGRGACEKKSVKTNLLW